MKPSVNHEPEIKLDSPLAEQLKPVPKLGPNNLSNNGEPKDPLPSALPFQRKLVIKECDVGVPEHDKDFIKSIAAFNALDGKQKVEEHARSRILRLHGQELGQLVEARDQAQENLNGIHREVQEHTAILEETDRYHEISTHNEPWTRFDVFQVISYGLASLSLLAVGLNSMARVLMASGIRAFEHPLPCYLFSMIPLVFPFAFKALGQLFARSFARKMYRVAIWLLGIGFASVWVWMFAKTFSGMTQDVSDILNSIRLDSPLQETGDFKWLLIVVSIFTEGFFAAGCWLTIEAICEKHQLCKRVANPAYAMVQEELSHWRRLEQEEREYLGKVQGRINAIQSAVQEYAQKALGFYEAARWLSTQQRELAELLKNNHL
jgi:hypothetical protein